jgi:hypothetical protein
MRRHRIGVAAAALLLAGCGAAVRDAAAPGPVPGGAGGRPAGPAATMPLESRPTVLRCADAARGTAPPPAAFLHVDGLASDGWGQLPTLPEIGPVSAGGRLYRFVAAFVYLTAQAAPWTTLRVVAPAGAWLYYTDFGTWTGGGNPLAAPVPHGPSKQVEVAACPGRGSGTAYAGGLLLPAPGCVTLRFTRSDSPTSRTATFRYGVPSC